jgi:hypothetical protein
LQVSGISSVTHETRVNRSGLPVSLISDPLRSENGAAPSTGLHIESQVGSVGGQAEGRTAFLSTLSLEKDGVFVPGWYGARASSATRKGKYRFDVRVHAAHSEHTSRHGHWRVGLGVDATTPERLGEGELGWSVDCFGILHVGGRTGQLCRPVQDDDVLTFGVDLDGITATFALNGRLLSAPRLTATTNGTTTITTTTNGTTTTETSDEVSWCESALRVPAAVRGYCF